MTELLVTLCGVGFAAFLAAIGWAVRRVFVKLDEIAGHMQTLAPRSDVEEVRDTLTLHLIEAADDRATMRAHIRHA